MDNKRVNNISYDKDNAEREKIETMSKRLMELLVRSILVNEHPLKVQRKRAKFAWIAPSRH